MTENELTFMIRGAIFKVYNNLGPGLLESVYSVALDSELRNLGLQVRREVPISFSYNEVQVDCAYKMDLLVNNEIIIELKSVEALKDVHHKQLLTYLKLTQKHLGLLVNFNEADMSKGIHRKVNGYLKN